MSQEESRSIEQFYELMVEQRVTVLNIVPSIFRHLMRADRERGESLSVGEIIFGGEALDVAGLRGWVERHGGEAKLVNMYGITETTVHVTYREIKEEEVKEGQASMIGEAIGDLRVGVMREGMRLAGIGIAGEMYVGGGGVSRGYIGKADVTAERYVPGESKEQEGERLYRTGDVGRRVEEGEIEYMGRGDKQVKVRGYRIEVGEVEAALRESERVEEAAVVVEQDQQGSNSLVAFVVPKLEVNYSGNDMSAMSSARVSEWENVFADTYARPPAEYDHTFNITGWESNYTGLPIPADEMREWLDETTQDLLSLKLRRVLEIGCGTGMILFRVAPHCARYVATDVSKTSLDLIRAGLQKAPIHSCDISLLCRAADDFEGMEEAEFDLLVLNSVTQYFPSADYLVRVLRSAVRLLKPEGIIYIGDVRSLPLKEAFYFAAEFSRAPESLTTKELKQAISRRSFQERELLLAPGFFSALSSEIPELKQVIILPKRGKSRNELTQFRYQAILKLGSERLSAENLSWIDWRQDQHSVEALCKLLDEKKPELVAIANIENARIARELEGLKLINRPDGPKTVGELKQQLESISALKGLEPADLTVFEALGYSVQTSWLRHDSEGRYDAVLKRASSSFAGNGVADSPFEMHTQNTSPQWRRYANTPLFEEHMRKLIPALRGSLQKKLPDYMIPAKIVVLEKLPLTPSGKLDRKALAHSHLALAASSEHKADEVMAMTPTQQLLCTIFEQVLSLDQVCLDDNFFELGGHSLLATQVISRARELFSVELSVRALFEQPTVRGLSAVVDEQVLAATGLTRPPIVARERQGPMRLSFAQQRLWFIEQMEPETPLYNIAGAVRLDGELDGRALERAINEVVRRHEALRTSIQSKDGVGVQVIELWEERPLSEIDMNEVSEEKREEESERVMKSEAEEPFKLSEGRLLRAKLIKQGAGRHILLYTMHHIISDGWSMGVMIREVGELYESYRKGEEVKLEEMVVQYGDYAEWQREWLEGEELERQMRYWREQLGGELGRLELGVSKRGGGSAAGRGGAKTGGRERLEIGEQMSRRLKEVCRQEGVTMFMLLMASFKVLLSRYSGQEEIIVGSPVAGRNSKEVEGLIGLFVNMLVLRSKVRGEEGFDEMLRREREVALGAYQHQDVPFEKLVEELSPERDLSHSPLFRVVFALQNAPSKELKLTGLKLTELEAGNSTTKFDLMLLVEEGAKGLIAYFIYDADLFDVHTIKRMAQHFSVLLESIGEEPQQRVCDLEMLPPIERTLLLSLFNRHLPSFPHHLCLHHLFQQQARLSPDSIAASFGHLQLSYFQLNRRANHLSHFLLSRGVALESKVGICLDRGIDLLVAMLAVLKAGSRLRPARPRLPSRPPLLHGRRLAAVAADHRQPPPS